MIEKIKKRPPWAVGLIIGIFLMGFILDIPEIRCIIGLSNFKINSVAFCSGCLVPIIWKVSSKWKK